MGQFFDAAQWEIGLSAMTPVSVPKSLPARRGRGCAHARANPSCDCQCENRAAICPMRATALRSRRRRARIVDKVCSAEESPPAPARGRQTPSRHREIPKSALCHKTKTPAVKPTAVSSGSPGALFVVLIYVLRALGATQVLMSEAARVVIRA